MNSPRKITTLIFVTSIEIKCKKKKMEMNFLLSSTLKLKRFEKYAMIES